VQPNRRIKAEDKNCCGPEEEKNFKDGVHDERRAERRGQCGTHELNFVVEESNGNTNKLLLQNKSPERATQQ